MILTGVSLGYDNCQSLDDLLAITFSGQEFLPGRPLPLRRIIQRALMDAGTAPGVNVQLVYQSSDNLEVSNPEIQDQLPSKWRFSEPQVFSADSAASLIPVLTSLHEQLRKQSGQIILLVGGSPIPEIGLVFEHTDSRTPGYARLDLSNSSPGNQDSPTADLGYLEISRPLDEVSGDQWSSLVKNIPASSQSHPAAVNSLQDFFSNSSGLISLVHAAGIIFHQTIPAASLPPASQAIPTAKHQKIYFPSLPQPWLKAGEQILKTSWLCEPARKGSEWGFIRLSESTDHKAQPKIWRNLQASDPFLIPFAAHTRQGITQRLKSMKKMVENGIPPRSISQSAYTEYLQTSNPTLAGCLIAENSKGLAREIDLALEGQDNALQSGREWSTPRGSSFTANPLGAGGAAVIYPGAFNAYPGMGRTLFHHFPVLHDLIQSTADNIRRSFAEDLLFPRKHDVTDQPDPSVLEAFYRQPVELIESGTTLSILHTLILKDIFNFQPRAALGYSLGEISMLWANQVWKDGDQSSRQWRESPLFREQIFGRMTAVRRYWPDENLADDFWGSYILKAPLAEVQREVDRTERVFITIINTAKEIVIAGMESACRKVIHQLECHALPMPFQAAIHNPAMESVRPDLEQLFQLKTYQNNALKFYSAAGYQPLNINPRDTASRISQMITQQVDFPRLVKQVYRDGIQVFIEVGPQKTCTRWVQKILADQPHTVIPINKKYQPDLLGVLKVISLLISHQVPLDLSALFPLSARKTQLADQLTGPQLRDNQAGPPSDNGQEKKSGAKPRVITHPAAAVTFQKQLSRHSDRLVRGQKSFQEYQTAITDFQLQSFQLGYPAEKAAQVPETDQKPQFSRAEIEAFTLGDPEPCFGSLFAGFNGRRIPVLPNSDLQYLDRILDVNAEPGTVKISSSLTSEFDIPHQDWYIGNQNRKLPLVSLLEIALQPCGFLAAYMGSITDHPEMDYYFRNLDGSGRLLANPDLAGETISNQVELTSHTKLGKTIIQHYRFLLKHNQEPFFEGKASFGYFPPEMLQNQAGLDGGKESPTWKKAHPQSGLWVNSNPAGRNSRPNSSAQPDLPAVDQVWISDRGGKYGQGYVYFELPIPESAWFFRAHFYQDPVMPGSLGLEAMEQALFTALPELHSRYHPVGTIFPESAFDWKYRGQITRSTRQILAEVHIKDIQQMDGSLTLTVAGNLWKKGLRIYEIENLAFVFQESER